MYLSALDFHQYNEQVLFFQGRHVLTRMLFKSHSVDFDGQLKILLKKSSAGRYLPVDTY